MKTIWGIGCCILFSLAVRSQEIKNDSLPYNLTKDEWNKVNETWSHKSRMIYVQTKDSTMHYGQLLAVNDSALVLYESEHMVNVVQQDSLMNSIRRNDVAAIFSLEPKHRFKSSTRGAVAGGAIGAAIGTTLHVLVRDKKFHPVFIAPVAGIATLFGAAIAPGKSEDKLMDTVWICTPAEVRDTSAEGRYEFIASTYRYTLFPEQFPAAVHWTGSSFSADTTISFDVLAAASPRMTTVFTPARGYFSVSAKADFSQHDDQLAGGELLLFNVGYRVNRRWSVDVYYGNSRSVVRMNTLSAGNGVMRTSNSALTCSYALLPHDRINLKRAQCYAGVGVAYSLVSIYDATPGRSYINEEAWGFMCKMDCAVFLTHRIAVVADVQQTFIQPARLPAFDWVQPQGIITVPNTVITTSHFRMGVGLRVHL